LIIRAQSIPKESQHIRAMCESNCQHIHTRNCTPSDQTEKHIHFFSCKIRVSIFLLYFSFNIANLTTPKTSATKQQLQQQQKRKKETEQGNQKIARDSKRKTAKKEETTPQSGSKSRK
jgi:hypothetical protein